ncbi:MAG: DUF3443 family protein, partial [Betaproteobacteria bacterium]|nr:DUF3443 family protein [Betaproteobacteria bacterium]
MFALLLASCGGGGGGSSPANSSMPSPSVTPNQVAVTVAQDPAIALFPTANLPYVSVTLCDNAGLCQTIDHIVLDTGSYGLRVLSSAITNLNLPATTSAGVGTLGECATFLGGFMWGGIHNATIKIAGETASNVLIELLGDPGLPGAPLACQGIGGTDIGNLLGIGGNGILGVGQFVEDQGSYYTCIGGPTGTCISTMIPPPNEVSNPVAFFSTDNNGIILQMPAISNTGQVSATGTLTFGIDTQSNNSVAGYQILPADSLGNFTATIAGQIYPQSFIDSGSDFNFITLSGYNTNGKGDYAPSAYTLLRGTLTPNSGLSGTPVPIQFGMIDTNTLNFFSFTAFN